MHVRNRLVFLTLLLGSWAGGSSHAAPSPTPEQLRLFQQLPASQREALMRQYLGTGAAQRRGVQDAGTDEVTDPAAEPADDGGSKSRRDETPVDREERLAREAKERDERDLRWCKRELRERDVRAWQRMIASGEPAPERSAEQLARVARAMGYVDGLEELPLDDRCEELVKRDLEQRFSLPRSLVKPFGYEMFTRNQRGAASNADLPVPADYTVGPGDTVEVQLFGKENEQHSLVVSRDGVLSFPGLGPITVAGLKFDAMQRLIEQRVAQQMIGVKASITMGPLRSIRVFVVGDAERPGSYTVSALATITHALYASGGIRPTGSLRNVQLKRDGKLVRQLDLYDLLLAGDTRDDLRLQSGDAIFIAPVGGTITVEGEVRRPAIYELRGETSVEAVLQLAGGLTPDAFPRSATLERIDALRDRTVLDLDLGSDAGRKTRVAAGDRLQVASVLDKLEDVVRVVGHVHRPKFAQWREGMRLTDLLPDVALLKPKADLGYLMIRRELRPGREIQVVSADLGAALADRGGAADILLQPRDQVFTFGIDPDRVLDIKPVLDELRAQARTGAPAQLVGITGSVRAPGEYPLESGMRISDLLRAAGQLAENAFLAEAELTRFTVAESGRREVEHLTVDLAAVLNGNAALDLELRPYDQLNIKPVPNWNEVEVVEVAGEVRFPGRYPLRKGETLQSVLQRAGGLTDYAFVAGAVLTREELRQREQQQLDRLADKLSQELTALSLEQVQSAQGGSDAILVGEQVARDVRSVKAVGRLVVDLEDILSGAEQVVAKNGDRLVVPRQTQEVTVIGEVQFATSHLHLAGLSRNDYIERSGGLTSKADKSRVFVVRANGRVDVGGRSSTIMPGDTIVAPLDTERMRPLVFWSTISQIVYQIALTAASAKTVGAF